MGASRTQADLFPVDANHHDLDQLSGVQFNNDRVATTALVISLMDARIETILGQSPPFWIDSEADARSNHCPLFTPVTVS